MTTYQHCEYHVVGNDICELCYYDYIHLKIRNHLMLSDNRLVMVK